jgi:hypothetical protein
MGHPKLLEHLAQSAFIFPVCQAPRTCQYYSPKNANAKWERLGMTDTSSFSSLLAGMFRKLSSKSGDFFM